MGFEPMTSRLSAERANQAVPLAYDNCVTVNCQHFYIYLLLYITVSVLYMELIKF